MTSEAQLEALFPGLRAGAYRVSSPASAAYNCFAWAAGDDDVWWEPDPMELYYWPAHAPREYSLTAYLTAFHLIGFVPCDGDHFEPDFARVAIYAKGNAPTHAARQVGLGRWTSKLGALEDIEHDLDGLVGEEYGSVARIFKRALPGR